MYCVHCGREAVTGGKFCGYCGTPLPELEEDQILEPASVVRPEPVPEPEPRLEPVLEPEPLQMPFTESAKQTLTWEEVIGRNVIYYFGEFQRVESEEKTKFNWAAFLFNASFCLYRKCTGLFQKYFLIPLIIMLVACLTASIGAARFSLTVMLLGGVGSAVGSIWSLINAIRIGRHFNAEYYIRCQQTIDSGNGRGCGTSLAAPILYNAALVVLVLLCSFAGVIFGSQGANNLPDMDSWSRSDRDVGVLNSGGRPGVLDTDTSSDSVVALSSGELRDIGLFLNSKEYNGFLQSVYTDVRDVLLTPIFYNYMDQSVDYDGMMSEYLFYNEAIHGGLSYVSRDVFEKTILERTGYEFIEMNNLGSFYFTYFSGSDAYCMDVSDSNYNAVRCLSGTKEDNIYTVIYESALGGDWYYETADGYESAATMTVTLRDGNNGWQFVSNVPNG